MKVIKKGAIECIFFSEFHPEVGPRLTYQVPDDCISREEFDILSGYFIPKPELLDKLITINVWDKKILGCPVGITNAKYSRNALLFNVGFVCSARTDVTAYEPIVKKLARYLVQMEVERGFISGEDSKAKIPDILSQLLNQLNQHGQCSLSVDESNTIHLKVVHSNAEVITVNDHHVPMFLTNADVLDSRKWDLATQQILPHIDGINHVKTITAKAGIELSVSKICLQNLIAYGVIKIIPVFQYTNVYLLQPDINKVVEDNQLLEDCIKYVTLEDHDPPSARSILQLYCALGPGTTVRDLCLRHDPKSLGVDE
ncbi:putative nitrogen permease regulator 2-like protein, partial [Apostichopus japonicus]